MDGYGPIADHWAAHGFVVVQPTHLDSTTLALAPEDPHLAVVVSGGRLTLGIGAGSRPGHPLARREYEVHGVPFVEQRDAIGGLAEACTVIRRFWSEDEPFDFEGDRVQLTGAFSSPKPVRRPHPPIPIGNRSLPLLCIVAEHADSGFPRWRSPDESSSGGGDHGYPLAHAGASGARRRRPDQRPGRACQ